MKTYNNFDRVARIYDKLSTLVFGKSMTDAQTIFLREIGREATVLILGGGTGWLLAEALRTNLTCKIWYIEASSNMIMLSKKKISQAEMSRVNFIHGTEDFIPAEISFDVVITPFYLDLFRDYSCHAVIQKIKLSLHAKSIWIITDFVSTAWWHYCMLFLMYRFFEITSHIEAARLPDWESMLKQHGFNEIKSNLFYSGFIKSTLVALNY
jgi:ubiquinone/menaquinone biosynthesis C-methylase UbiE